MWGFTLLGRPLGCLKLYVLGLKTTLLYGCFSDALKGPPSLEHQLRASLTFG